MSIFPRAFVFAAALAGMSFTSTVTAAKGPSPKAGVGLVKVVVRKSERVLEIYRASALFHRFSVALGGNPQGHKQQEGDERTPEGIYTLDWRNAGSSFYRSIHISYPDAEDQAKAEAMGQQPGGMIMVHGQRNGLGWLYPVTQLFDWTNGCIAVSNADMDIIWTTVPDGTPIEILP